MLSPSLALFQNFTWFWPSNTSILNVTEDFSSVFVKNIVLSFGDENSQFFFPSYKRWLKMLLSEMITFYEIWFAGLCVCVCSVYYNIWHLKKSFLAEEILALLGLANNQWINETALCLYPELLLYLVLTHQANTSPVINHPRARYQETNHHSFSPHPARITQTS